MRAAGESCRLMRSVAEQQSIGGAEQTVTAIKKQVGGGGTEAGLKLLGARQVQPPAE